MRKRLLLTGALAGCFGLAHAQANLTTRSFTYDGTSATNGTATYEVQNFTVVQNSATLNNQIISAAHNNATFLLKTVIQVQTYVQVSGNFGAEYSVRGPGTTTDAARTSDITIRTNRALTFSTSGFTTLRNASNVSVNVGTMAYALTLFTDSPAVSQVGSPISGTDTAFNGKSLSIVLTDLPSNGAMTLRLSRTLAVNRLAVGNQTYNATGTVVLTVN